MPPRKTAENKNENLSSREFLLFEFIDPNVTGNKEVDFSRRDWVSDDFIKNVLMVKFMPPQHDDESFQLLNQLIETKAPPPGDWPMYPIELKGHAGKHKEISH